MEARNKLLLPICGKPMIRHVVETYLAAVDSQVCVVTGFEADRINVALAGLPIQFVRNADYEAGQQFSVRAGLLEAPDAQHHLIGLGDQPQLTADDLARVNCGAFGGRCSKNFDPFPRFHTRQSYRSTLRNARPITGQSG